MDGLRDLFNQLGWVDFSALVILLVFFVLGLFRGLVWQLTRLLAILLGFVVAGSYAKDLARILEQAWPESSPFALYVSYFAIFLLVFVVLSIIAWVVTRLLRRLNLSIYDRLGGGIMGILTGGAIIVFLLTVMYAFIPANTGVIMAAERSRTKPAAIQMLRYMKDKVGLAFVDPALKTLDTKAARGTSGKKGEEKKEGSGEPRKHR